MTHRFDRYFRSHGHYPRARVRVGTARASKRVEWEITPTYLIIRTHVPGRSITIPREQLVTLLKWAIPLVREMERDPSRVFDPEAAISEYLEREAEDAQALRQLKRDLYGTCRRSKRRSRRTRST